MAHSSITVTLDRYGHLFPGARAEAAALLNRYLDAEAPTSRSRPLVPVLARTNAGAGSVRNGLVIGNPERSPMTLSIPQFGQSAVCALLVRLPAHWSMASDGNKEMQ